MDPLFFDLWGSVSGRARGVSSLGGSRKGKRGFPRSSLLAAKVHRFGPFFGGFFREARDDVSGNCNIQAEPPESHRSLAKKAAVSYFRRIRFRTESNSPIAKRNMQMVHHIWMVLIEQS
jgi:hypothetical protein